MKQTGFILIVALAFLSVAFVAASPNGETFRGQVMDSQCAKMGSHELMMTKEGARDAKECALDCLQMGGKFVLYDASTKTIYQLDNQQGLSQFAGQQVKIKGAYDKATKTIRVSDITPISLSFR